MDKDLLYIIEGWDYDPDDFLNNVKKIIGRDNRQKIQLRTDLGVFQMEITGRPDGKRPGGKNSLLDYYLSKSKEEELKSGDKAKFKLTEQDIAKLYREALQYYHRRICFFALKNFESARRDAEHTLRIMDLVKKYSISKWAVFHFEQYRPYMIGEKIRAIVLHCLEKKDYQGALRSIQQGINEITNFYKEYNREDFVDKCQQIRFLKQWQKELRKEWEEDISEGPQTTLSIEEQLEIAILQENYEEAARLRDIIRAKKEELDQER
jgi:hypothetical protein